MQSRQKATPPASKESRRRRFLCSLLVPAAVSGSDAGRHNNSLATPGIITSHKDVEDR